MIRNVAGKNIRTGSSSFPLNSICSNRVTLRSNISFQKRSITSFNGIADVFTMLHDNTGLSWLVLIPLTTFTLRTFFTLPLSVMQRKRIVKQQELRKVVQATTPIVRLRLAGAVSEANNRSLDKAVSKDTVAESITVSKLKNLTPDQIRILSIKETRNRQKKMFKKYNVQIWKNAMLPLIQMPLWVSVSLGIRSLTELRIHRSSHEWFESFRCNGVDLIEPWTDYPLVFPIVLGTLSMLNVEYNGRMMSRKNLDSIGIESYTDESSRVTQSFKSILNLSRIGCIFMIGVSSQAPILLSLYWVCSQLYSIIQNVILDYLWPYKR